MKTMTFDEVKAIKPNLKEVKLPAAGTMVKERFKSAIHEFKASDFVPRKLSLPRYYLGKGKEIESVITERSDPVTCKETFMTTLRSYVQNNSNFPYHYIISHVHPATIDNAIHLIVTGKH